MILVQPLVRCIKKYRSEPPLWVELGYYKGIWILPEMEPDDILQAALVMKRHCSPRQFYKSYQLSILAAAVARCDDGSNCFGSGTPWS